MGASRAIRECSEYRAGVHARLILLATKNASDYL